MHLVAYISCIGSQVSSTKLCSVLQLFTFPGEKFLMLLPELPKCPQHRLLLNIRCITAHPSSQNSGVTAAAGLKSHLTLQRRKAEVFLPATSSTIKLSCCPQKEPTPQYQAHDIIANLFIIKQDTNNSELLSWF